MDIFKQLQEGAKFDLKRFGNDAKRLALISDDADVGSRKRKKIDRDRRSRNQNQSKKIKVNLPSSSEEDSSSGGDSDDGEEEESKTNSGDEFEYFKGSKLKNASCHDDDVLDTEVDVEIAEIEKFRQTHRIHIGGGDIPAPVANFQALQTQYGFSDRLMQNIAESGYDVPTPIQMQAVPVMLKRRNIMACAPTGSGKTAAFLLPILHHLSQHKTRAGGGTRALILAPVRELAVQLRRECERLAEGLGLTVQTADKLVKRAAAQIKRCDVIVTTPMLLLSVLKARQEAVSLSSVEWLVVDECDRLFERGAGFSLRQQLGEIYKRCVSADLRRALFSATYARDVETWCTQTFDNVVQVYIGDKNTATETVEQQLVFTGNEDGKLMTLKNIIRKGVQPPVLIFVQSKSRAQQLYHEIVYEGVTVTTVHADKDQKQRDAAIKQFRSGDIWVLVCTQLMGRGIDFVGVNLVINYDFPQSAISYIHTIGRTGRAGRQGKAITFFTKRDITYIRTVADVMKNAGCPVPEYLLTLQQPDKKQKKRLLKGRIRRKGISTVPREMRVGGAEETEADPKCKRVGGAGNAKAGPKRKKKKSTGAVPGKVSISASNTDAAQVTKKRKSKAKLRKKKRKRQAAAKNESAAAAAASSSGK